MPEVSISVRFIPNRGAFAAVNTEQGMVGRAVRTAGNTTVERAKANVTSYGRVDTGFMRDSIRVRGTQVGSESSALFIGSDAPYTRYQHEGTRFIRPAPFLTDALRELSPSDFHQ